MFGHSFKRLAVLLALAFSLAPAAAFAGPFPDVPDEYPYATSIGELKELKIMRGNPDGTGTPERLLNRAELLTLLYRTTDRIPRSVYGDCFDDVKEGWYEDVVCDAAHEGFVGGFPDHTFKAEQFVTRVEFFKMLLNVMGFTVPELSQADKLSIDFLGNVTHSAWYAKYLHRALSLKLVPEAYIVENMFDPSLPVTRGEAAEMIARAMRTEDIFFQEEMEEEMEEESATDEQTDVSEEEEGATGAPVVPFPIHRSAETGDRGTSTFVFDLPEDDTILIHATHKAGASVSCFLYLLEESGFSYEFFIGYKEDNACLIRASVPAGHYQVEVRTDAPGEMFALDAEPTSGDGNDGFAQAVTLRPGFARSGALTPDDYQDLFKFKILKAETRRLTCSSSAKIGCSIAPWSDVDLFGEQGPLPGLASVYQPGTYYLFVTRAYPASASQAYTIDLR